MILQPYKQGSGSARALANELRIPRVLLARTRCRPGVGGVINWGSTRQLFDPRCYAMNKPTQVKLAAHKRHSFANFHAYGVQSPEYTTDRSIAEMWRDAGDAVVVRTKVMASGGAGIHIVEGSTEMPLAPLYTKYAKKKDEYRVHVLRGEVIHVQQKRRRLHCDVDSRIRNSEWGWVFCINDVNPHATVLSNAVAAVECLNLDYGAVDVGWNERNQMAYVYEVNTAPGLEGTTLDKVAAAIMEEYL